MCAWEGELFRCCGYGVCVCAGTHGCGLPYWRQLCSRAHAGDVLTVWQANNIMPLLVCTVIAYSVAGCFTVSLYDMMLEINNLPYVACAGRWRDLAAVWP